MTLGQGAICRAVIRERVLRRASFPAGRISGRKLRRCGRMFRADPYPSESRWPSAPRGTRDDIAAMQIRAQRRRFFDVQACVNKRTASVGVGRGSRDLTDRVYRVSSRRGGRGGSKSPGGGTTRVVSRCSGATIRKERGSDRFRRRKLTSSSPDTGSARTAQFIAAEPSPEYRRNPDHRGFSAVE